MLPTDLAQLIINYLPQTQLIDYFILQSLNFEPFVSNVELSWTVDNLNNFLKSLKLNIIINAPKRKGLINMINNNGLSYTNHLTIIDNENLISILTYLLQKDLINEDIKKFNNMLSYLGSKIRIIALESDKVYYQVGYCQIKSTITDTIQLVL